ncbi:MAG TPA: hypothetical protein VND21_07620 [Planctomycetota bacterium]|nr:hypothetical protein [Planctomycetota bacterium]
MTDRIRLAWRAEGELLDAMRAHGAWLGGECLATSLVEDPSLERATADAVPVEEGTLLARLEVVRG